MRTPSTSLAVVGLAVAIGIASGPSPATAAPASDPVTSWISQHGQRPAAIDAAAGDAVVVGLGESAHGGHHQATLKLNALRRLIERDGFRSVAWEEDWITGRAINRFVTSGRGRAADLVRRMTGQWQSLEMVRTLRWLRGFNAAHADDQVRFVGVEYYYTGRAAYDAVRRYVATTSPDRLPALRADFRVIYPDLPDPAAYAEKYAATTHKARYLRHARHLVRLVDGLPHAQGDPAYALVRQHARQISAFHEHYAMPMQAQDDYRELHAARNLRWWQQRTGDRIVYWAAAAHTAAARHLRIALPGAPDFRYRATGSYLRDWYHRRYVSAVFTFDHGAVGLRPDEVTPQPSPADGWLEAPLGRVDRSRFLVDLRAKAPAPVRRWLGTGLTMRGMPWAPGSTITGGSVRRLFDLVVHVQREAPQRGL